MSALEKLPVKLLVAGRCCICATPIQKGPKSTCPQCQIVPHADQHWRHLYDQHVVRRVPLVLIVCALLGFIPVVGILPAVVCYRILLVRPYARVVGLGQKLGAKWGLRVLLFVMAWLQFMPGVGAIAIPVLAFISHRIWRRAYVGMAKF